MPLITGHGSDILIIQGIILLFQEPPYFTPSLTPVFGPSEVYSARLSRCIGHCKEYVDTRFVSKFVGKNFSKEDHVLEVMNVT